MSHVCLVHCETTTGILNELDEIAQVVKTHDRRLIVDAMSSFGALPISARSSPMDAVIASSGKCLEGVPGIGFSLVRRDALESSKGNAHSLVLNLHDQWAHMEATDQWRWTPSTHAIAALHVALEHFHAEGGRAGRFARYHENWSALTDGMRQMGFDFYVPIERQAPIIVTVLNPRDPNYSFARLYGAMKQRGFIIYPGKLTKVDTFRIGCIGQITPNVMRSAVAALRASMEEMGVSEFAAAK